MGQQQLLLLVLGVIIVGVAIVAGIGMFNASAEESVKDEITSQLMAISANAQQWYKKPAAMGGGGGTFLNYSIPIKMRATSSFGVVDLATGDASTAGYTITGVGTTTQIVFHALPLSTLDYDWVADATVSPTNIVTAITP